MTLTKNRELRERFAVKHRKLLDEVTALLGQDDRIGIVYKNNPFEYSIESDAIVKDICRCHTVEDVACLAYEVYDRMFGPGGVGSQKDYAQLARKIWGLWQECLQDDADAWSLLDDEAVERGGNSHCISTTRSCPKCKAKTEVFKWDCVNGTDDPSLRDDLLEGRLNVLKCGGCGAESPIDGQSICGDDLFYVDTRRGYSVQYCSLWMERMEDPAWRNSSFKDAFTRDAKLANPSPVEAIDDPAWRNATSKGSFARDAKLATEPPSCLADPHLVLDMGELRRYVRFRDKLFDLYEELGDESLPPSQKPADEPRKACQHVVRVFDPNNDPSVAENLKKEQGNDPRVTGIRCKGRFGLVETPKGTFCLDDTGFRNNKLVGVDDPVAFNFYREMPDGIEDRPFARASFSLEECMAMLTGEEIPLREFVQRDCDSRDVRYNRLVEELS